MDLLPYIFSLMILLILASFMARLAEKRGRSSATWFFIGFFFGLLGLLVLLLLPKETTKLPREKKRDLLEENREKWRGNWFFVDQNGEKKGAISLEDLTGLWNAGKVNEESYVWREEMEQWVRIRELPLFKEALLKGALEADQRSTS